MKKEKTGGRTKGVPNIKTEQVRQLGKDLKEEAIIPLLKYFILNIEPENKELKQAWLTRLIYNVKPEVALYFLGNLINYAVPKLKSTTVDVNANVTEKTIEDTLAELSAENELQ